MGFIHALFDPQTLYKRKPQLYTNMTFSLQQLKAHYTEKKNNPVLQLDFSFDSEIY